MVRLNSCKPYLLLALISVFGICSGQAESLRPTPSSQATAILVQKLLQDHHFAGKPLTEEKAKDWIKAYMESLDYNHAFFLQTDLQELQNTYATQLSQLTLSLIHISEPTRPY